MEKIAIIGAGISGLTVANELKSRYSVRVFEKENVPGGLIRCKRVNGNLFHICGGHIFNTKRSDVQEWFWSHFDCDKEFVKSDRNSYVYMPDGLMIPYPIENHMYLLNADIQKNFIDDLLSMSEHNSIPDNFEDFLKSRFGRTLYELYFRPYNEKVWHRPLSKVPLSWLEGKLPMPSAREMIFNNMNRIEEKSFVHSTFWYEKEGGSQFIADRLAEGISISYGKEIQHIEKVQSGWIVEGEMFDKVVFCGNIKDLPSMLKNFDIDGFFSIINNLEYHGTTSVFCDMDSNPYSWIYLPGEEYASHRIICTGNFAKSNNAPGKMTGTVEFTDYVDPGKIEENLAKTPFSPHLLDVHYSKYSYPIQDKETRPAIKALKEKLSREGFHFTGRFADWEYYNMDVAMGAAIDLCKSL